jgi:hypothetical protein
MVSQNASWLTVRVILREEFSHLALISLRYRNENTNTTASPLVERAPGIPRSYETALPLGPLQGPRHSPTLWSYEAAVFMSEVPL